jgi:23S rRNA pseudouridine1911/1915/1917 synthase
VSAWLPEALNGGWVYRDRVEASAAGLPLSAWYAERYRHSPRPLWLERLAAGEIERNGCRLAAEVPLLAGDRLAWHRPPWLEPAVPGGWSVLHDDGDLHVIAKPSGLPVLPAGGFLEHTVLRLLERRHGTDPAGVPRPLHRLGRFTSGLLVCARRPATRAWLSRLLRESTAAAAAESAAAASGSASASVTCRKLYRALLPAGGLPLAPGEPLVLTTPIGRRSHPRLGRIWCAATPGDPAALAAHSLLRLCQRRADGDLVEVAIASGRPHQIRIHCAAAGAPLLGDPLYRPGGLALASALPGDGGYHLHALALRLQRPDGTLLELRAPPPPPLSSPADPAVAPEPAAG